MSGALIALIVGLVIGIVIGFRVGTGTALSRLGAAERRGRIQNMRGR